eukprot:2785486-Pyramimonas_sp.AAC.2
MHGRAVDVRVLLIYEPANDARTRGTHVCHIFLFANSRWCPYYARARVDRAVFTTAPELQHVAL